MANLFSFSRKTRAIVFVSLSNDCQMTVKSRVLHLFPVSETGRSHIINILLASFFSIDFFALGPYIDGTKRGSVIYNTDRKNEANKRHVFLLSYFWSIVFSYSSDYDVVTSSACSVLSFDQRQLPKQEKYLIACITKSGACNLNSLFWHPCLENKL